MVAVASDECLQTVELVEVKPCSLQLDVLETMWLFGSFDYLYLSLYDEKVVLCYTYP